MKKVGIVADNYKVEKFKAELTKIGLTFDITPFSPATTTIRVDVPTERVTEVAKLCQLVEMHFKQSN